MLSGYHHYFNLPPKRKMTQSIMLANRAKATDMTREAIATFLSRIIVSLPWVHCGVASESTAGHMADRLR
jgi:hypothetical protein